MKRLMLLGAIAGALAGCLDQGPADDGLAKAISAVEAIEAANHSPEATVTSWWRVKDASAMVRVEICKNNLKLSAPYFEKLSQLSTDDLVNVGECGEKPPSFDRQITKVDVQSITRVVVTARIRNVTPPEEGAVLDADAKRAKEAGEPFQYVLERKDLESAWKIIAIASLPAYASDWQEVYVKPEPSSNQYVYGFYQ